MKELEAAKLKALKMFKIMIGLGGYMKGQDPRTIIIKNWQI